VFPLHNSIRIDSLEAVFTHGYLDVQLSIYDWLCVTFSRFRKIHNSRKFFERVAPRDPGFRKNRSRIVMYRGG